MSRQTMQDMVKELSTVPPVECEFKLGDTVSYTNEYGIKFDGLKIIGFETKEGYAYQVEENFRPYAFIYLDWTSYWFSVGVERLELTHRYVPR